MKKVLVGIVIGSDSDLEIMKDATKILDELGVENEIMILSAHRVPNETLSYAKSARGRGIKVLIGGAGGAAALPGVLASLTILPVIGVPIKTKTMEGLDSLLSICQMPPGVPVATVGINSAKNAGILATKIIAVSDGKVAKNLDKFMQKMKKEVLSKNSNLKKLGWAKYINKMNK